MLWSSRLPDFRITNGLVRGHVNSTREDVTIRSDFIGEFKNHSAMLLVQVLESTWS